MRKILTMFAVAAAITLAGSIAAKEGPDNEKLTGTIKSVDAKSLVLQVETADKKLVSFSVTGNTKIAHGETASALEEFKAGSKVVVIMERGKTPKVAVAIELAEGKNIDALRMCMDRVYPKGRDRPTPFELPQIAAPKDAVVAVSTIVQAVADGDLTTAEAAELIKVVQGYSQTVWDADIEERLKRIEGKLNDSKKA